MTLGEIEAQLQNLTTDELRRLALTSWSAFVEKEGSAGVANVCDENDPDLLAALDEAVAAADRTPDKGLSGDEVRASLRRWITR